MKLIKEIVTKDDKIQAMSDGKIIISKFIMTHNPDSKNVILIK